MKKFKSLIAILICFIMTVMPACKSIDTSSELKIGVSGLQGTFNPFYYQSEADGEVVAQMFRSIQRRDSDNKLINHSGGISYEYVGDSQVKYTVSIKEDLFFTNGKNITIDDVIFFYTFISDATYDGIYSDWYLNDIVGLKEYYFDDKNYQSSIAKIEEKIENNYTLVSIETDDYIKYLAATKLEGKFNGNLASVSPSGATWREYLIKLGYGEALSDLGNNPSEEKIINIVARAEAESNRLAYNPENWYRNKLYSEYINKNYEDGIDVESIEGIKKVDDYTCTVLFNSRNINAISELNALLVSKDYLSVEYVKGSAEKIKDLGGYDVCSGPYIVTDYRDGVVSMISNNFYDEGSCEFSNIKFVELSSDKDIIKQVISGKVDVVETLATADAVNELNNKNVRYFIEDCDYYVSLFLNARTLDSSARKALVGLCDINSTLEQNIGSYYTRLLRPISVRFEEYPVSVTSPYFSESAFTVYSMGSNTKITEASVYYCGSESDLEMSVLAAYKDILAKKGITLNIVITDEQSLENAVVSGKADMWVENVYDGNTCDKYDYFNSNGRLNKTAVGTSEIDRMTESIRSAIGYSNKTQMTAQLMELVMEQAVECPLYQLQKITVYNTDTVSPESFTQAGNMDGYTYSIPLLKKS